MAFVNLLDNTIRDGSYALDFCFTPEDTAFLANLLEKAGFPFIEIGHGLGLGACREPQWRMPQLDEAYLRQTREAITKSQLGVFFIPGIGTEDDLRLGRDCGMDFVRIGTNVTEAEEGHKFIRLAKKLGYFVAANLMKSYAVPPEEFARIGARLQDQEVDIVYLVDSAGGMIPHEIRRYLDEVREVCGVPMGFHGHNNLSLAAANSIEAVDCGASMVDCSLTGLGRSAGNAASESVLAILERKGVQTGVDLFLTLDIAEKYIKTLFSRPESNGIAVASGLAKFHSGFLDKVLKYADQYKIEPKRLITAAAAINPISTDDKAIQAAAEQILEQQDETIQLPRNTVLQYQEKKGSEFIIQNADDSLKSLLKGMRILSRKKGLRTIIILRFIQDQILKTTLSEYCYDDDYFIVGKVLMDVYSLTENLIKDLDGQIDCLLMDSLGLSAEQARTFLDKLKKHMGDDAVFSYNSLINRQQLLSNLVRHHVIENNSRNLLVYGTHGDLIPTLKALAQYLDGIYLVSGKQPLDSDFPADLGEDEPLLKKIISVSAAIPQKFESHDSIDLVLALSEPTLDDAQRLMRALSKKGAVICPPHYQVFHPWKNKETFNKKLIFLDTDQFLSSQVIEVFNFKKILSGNSKRAD